MKILETTFTSRSFNFKQLAREGDFAIYEKKNPNHSTPSFEVIKIKRHNGYTIAGNYCPPSEMYPSDSAWGTDGFTATTKDEAYKKMDWLMENKTQAEEAPTVKRGRGRPKGSKSTKQRRG